jgi:hypothetical protein
MASLGERLWAKVERSDGDGCWLWTGAVSGRNKYGYIGVGGGKRNGIKRAHRVAYELEVGPIPPGMLVCHKCDTPRCVRPDHLFLGTPADNTADMVRKGRAARDTAPKGEKSPHAKITEAVAIEIRRAFGSANAAVIAKRYGVGRGTVWGIWCRRSWRHIA